VVPQLLGQRGLRECRGARDVDVTQHHRQCGLPEGWGGGSAECCWDSNAVQREGWRMPLGGVAGDMEGYISTAESTAATGCRAVMGVEDGRVRDSYGAEQRSRTGWATATQLQLCGLL
jgi:hypothetical protein